MSERSIGTSERAAAADAEAPSEPVDVDAADAGGDGPPRRISSRPSSQARQIPGPGAGVLALLSLAWLGATLWGLQREISTSVTDAVAIASAAISLPNVVSASLVAGAATGALAVNLIARAGWTATARWAGALGASILVGLLAALGVIAGYDGVGSGVLAGTIAAAAVVGGAIAGLRPTCVVTAVTVGALVEFAVVFVLNFLGVGVTYSSGALTMLVAALIGAVCGGIVPFVYLRRVTRRESTEAGALRWPAYMLAGAGVGLALLVTELITRVGGGQVLDAVASLSDFDRAFRANADADRLMFALIVLFVGAVAATIALGRTLPSPSSKKRVEL